MNRIKATDSFDLVMSGVSVSYSERKWKLFVRHMAMLKIGRPHSMVCHANKP